MFITKKAQKKADEYFARLVSSAKREFAEGYWDWLRGLRRTPVEPRCSDVAAEHIRMRLNGFAGERVLERLATEYVPRDRRSVEILEDFVGQQCRG